MTLKINDLNIELEYGLELEIKSDGTLRIFRAYVPPQTTPNAPWVSPQTLTWIPATQTFHPNIIC